MFRRHVFAASAFCLALAVAGVARAEGARSCAVERMTGSGARYWLEGAWLPIAPGPLPDHVSLVATGPDARLEIVCRDGLRIAVGTETEADLETLVEPSRGQGAVIRIVEGILGLVAPSGAAPGPEVRTPLAIASVRSTEWHVQHDAAAAKSAVFVREGAVAVRARDGAGAATLRAGEGVDIGAGGLGETKRWGVARVAAAGERLGFGWP